MEKDEKPGDIPLLVVKTDGDVTVGSAAGNVMRDIVARRARGVRHRLLYKLTVSIINVGRSPLIRRRVPTAARWLSFGFVPHRRLLAV